MPAFVSWILRSCFHFLIRMNCLLNNACQYLFCKFISAHNKKINETSSELKGEPPKEWDNPKFGTHHFIRLKEVKLHYVTKGKDGDTLMLCIHGFPECWFTWHHILEHFSNNYKVVAVDLRGFSLSDKPFGIENYRKDKIAEDIKQLIEALGYKDCVVIGQGVGSLYLWELVTEYPSLVKKMIFIQGSHPSALVQYMKANWLQAFLLIPILFFHLPFLPELLYQSFSWKLLDLTFNGPTGLQTNLLTDQQLACYRYAFQQSGALTGALNHYRSIFLSGKTSTLFKITTPGLLIWGCKDPFLQVDLAKASKEFVEDLTLKLIPQSGHWVLLDQPAMVHTHIEEFLNKLPTK